MIFSVWFYLVPLCSRWNWLDHLNQTFSLVIKRSQAFFYLITTALVNDVSELTVYVPTQLHYLQTVRNMVAHIKKNKKNNDSGPQTNPFFLFLHPQRSF